MNCGVELQYRLVALRRGNNMFNKQKRTPNSIGVNQYDFNFRHEINIYSYLYGTHTDIKIENELEEQLKFDYYNDWKKYIQNKYDSYDSEKLMEFSRYLEHRIGRGKPERGYWNIVISAIMSLVTMVVADKVFDMLRIETAGGVISTILCYLIVAILIFIAFVLVAYIMIKLLIPLLDSNTKENFFIDYREIIESMVEEKVKQEKKNAKKKTKKKKCNKK